jgi:hypothetical protein
LKRERKKREKGERGRGETELFMYINEIGKILYLIHSYISCTMYILYI